MNIPCICRGLEFFPVLTKAEVVDIVLLSLALCIGRLLEFMISDHSGQDSIVSTVKYHEHITFKTSSNIEV